MLKHKYIDKICIIAIIIAMLLTILLIFGEQLGIQKASSSPAYAKRLFDDSKVHTIDIQIENFDSFIKNAQLEEYTSCTVVIDGESFHQVGLRTKGNN